jgi:hypothetical protein
MARGEHARRRTAPYLGIACLALLAFAGVYAAPELSALGEAPALGLPALTWLAERAAQPGATLLLGARLAGRAGPRWAPWPPRRRAAPPPAAHRATRPTPRARGALAVPALLIAVALARTH